MRVVVVEAPKPVVTVEEAAAHLRVDAVAEEGPIIEAMIAAATAHIDGPDGWLGRAIGVQTLAVMFDPPQCELVRLPFLPIINLVAVNYFDAGSAAHSAQPSDVQLIGDEVMPTGSDWPWAGRALRRLGCRIQYRAGYEKLPAAIRAAILLMVGDLYRNRGETAAGAISAVPMSVTVANLLAPFRVFR